MRVRRVTALSLLTCSSSGAGLDPGPGGRRPGHRHHRIAEPTTNAYTVTGHQAGTYYHRVAGLFNTPTIAGAQGPWSNTIVLVVKLSDLAIASSDISVSQTKNTATITATVHNVGTADAANVGVRFLFDGAQVGTDQTIATVPAAAPRRRPCR